MILITDAHVSLGNDNEIEFFKMLDKIEKTDHDVVFLGDIFELWIAMPRYEEDMHIKFLDWCKNQKEKRQIGYVEGNHEFFLKDEKSDNFSWISTDFRLDPETNILFGHGDLINEKDTSYRIFRKVTKNKLMKQLVRYMPLAPSLVRYIKKKMTNSNKKRGFIPHDTLNLFACNKFKEGIKTIMLGHFHNEYCYEGETEKLYSLPDWMDTGKISVYDCVSKELTSCKWTELNIDRDEN